MSLRWCLVARAREVGCGRVDRAPERGSAGVRRSECARRRLRTRLDPRGRAMTAAVHRGPGAGEFDGEEFGDGECTLPCTAPTSIACSMLLRVVSVAPFPRAGASWSSGTDLRDRSAREVRVD